ncbi:MAG: hypothetical protein NUW01_15615 [Gemmatimonadaceae bacterium]|nr:hypothetical protein [Gemmatimonadaceae bacterium]
MNSRRRLGVSITGSLALLSLACSPDQLSRATAEQALRKLAFPVAEERILGSYGKIGNRYWNMGVYPAQEVSIDWLLGTNWFTESVAVPRGNYSRVTLLPTDAIKPFVLETLDAFGAPVYRVKLHEFAFDAISGIVENNQTKTATVEYTIRRVNWTPFGDYFRKQDPSKYAEQVAAKAQFVKYDDGWRIAQ